MTDLSKTIDPKSLQLNADDLIAGDRTITITSVKVVSGDQPVQIFFDGDGGKPFLPCKSMRRVLVKAWGSDGDKYVGRSLRLFNDPAVKWAGDEVGGIRISHMSNLEADFHMSLTVSKGRRSPIVIKPLTTTPLNALSDADFESYSARIETSENMAELGVIGEEIAKARLDKVGAARIKPVYAAAVKRIREGSGSLI